MIITKATELDIPDIVDLLKVSLGETLMPKSEQYWRWKHQENFFGKSNVLVAKESDRIIGVRAFMNWAWQNDTNIVKSVRAVDTATHPDFQGKGIFSKLTLKAVEESAQEGISMVFNTPNKKSMPGYLKLGWQEAGHLPVFFKFGSLFPRVYSKDSVQSLMSDFSIDDEIKKINSNYFVPITDAVYQTKMDVNFLKWRYVDCPVANYGAVIQPDKFGLVFRLKKLNRFIELRICEVWLHSTLYQSALNKAISDIIRMIRPLIITTSSSSVLSKNSKKIKGFWGPFANGPMVTVRKLSDSNFVNFDLSKNWMPSLGSMELF